MESPNVDTFGTWKDGPDQRGVLIEIWKERGVLIEMGPKQSVLIKQDVLISLIGIPLYLLLLLLLLLFTLQA